MTNWRQKILFLTIFGVVFAFDCAAQDFAAFADILRRGGNQEQKRAVLFQIRNLRSEAASRVAVHALRDPSEIVRATAAFAVRFLPPDEAFAALAPNLNDKAEIVRRETAYALGAVGDARAVAALLQRFGRDKSIEVKNALIVAVGAIGDRSAIDFLAGVLQNRPKRENDADEFLRRAAARSVGQIAQIIQTGERRVLTPENFLPEKYKLQANEKYADLARQDLVFASAVAVLTRMLNDRRESDDARREAAFALGAVGASAAIPVLRVNLNAADYYLAEICREALRKIASAAQTEQSTLFNPK